MDAPIRRVSQEDRAAALFAQELETVGTPQSAQKIVAGSQGDSWHERFPHGCRDRARALGLVTAIGSCHGQHCHWRRYWGRDWGRLGSRAIRYPT